MSKKIIIILIAACCFVFPHVLLAQGRHSISGFVYEKGSRESMPGVNIYVPGTTIGTVSNSYGFFSLTLPVGEWEVIFPFVGYQPRSYSINLDKSIELLHVLFQPNKFY